MKSLVAVFVLAFVLSCNCDDKGEGQHKGLDEAIVQLTQDFDVSVNEAKIVNEKEHHVGASLDGAVEHNWDVTYGEGNEIVRESTPTIDGTWSFDDHSYDVETTSAYTGELDWTHDKGDIKYSKVVDVENVEDHEWNPKEGSGEFYHEVDVVGGKEFTIGDEDAKLDFSWGKERVDTVEVDVDNDLFYLQKEKDLAAGGNIYAGHDGSQLFNIVDSHYSHKKETANFEPSGDSPSDDATSDDEQISDAHWKKKESRYDHGELEIGNEDSSIHTRDSYSADFGGVKLNVKDLDLLRSFILATDAPLLKYLIVDILDQKLV